SGASTTRQRENMPVIADVLPEQEPLTGVDALLVIDRALTVRVIDLDRQLDPLVCAIAHEQRGLAALELEVLGLELGQRDVTARERVERVPRRERRLLEL